MNHIRNLFIALASVMLLALGPAAAHAGEVKVLILDKGFDNVPEKDEKLKKLDDVDGRLVLGYTSYLGKLSIWKGKGGLYLVNSLELEDYVKGVVLAETGRDWAPEALKAQAVIVRTYVLSRLARTKRPEYDVTSSVLHQVYRGLNSDVDVEAAVNSTRGEVLTYEGQPIEAFYHSTSVGSTEVAENVFGRAYPYLKSVEASGRLSPYAFWNRRVSLRDFEAAAGLSDIKSISIAVWTSTDRVDKLRMVAADGEHMVEAKELRRKLGWRKLPSTDFEIHMEGAEVVMDGKGYGHGVGLCQWTALEMALDGKGYKEILSHFYPGAEISLKEDL